jgi:uncharacterized protein YhbP (UPF0306 family)
MTGNAPLPPVAHDLIHACASLSLAFGDEDGPWAATLYFVADDAQNLYFTSSANSRHGKLQDGHGVAATIAQDSPNWRSIRGIQCSGVLGRVAQADHDRVRTLYLAKFPDLAGMVSAPIGIEEERIAAAFARNPLFILHTHVLRVIDNAGGFALRETFVRDEAGNWTAAANIQS